MANDTKVLDLTVYVFAVIISLVLGWHARMMYAQDKALDRNELFFDEVMSDAQGSYDPKTGFLLFKTKSYNSLFVREGILHEYGHVLYLRDFTNDQILEYENIYNKTEDYSTAYARISASEDFSETYARSIVCEINYSAIPFDRVDFFKRNLNEAGNRVISQD